ncbi:MAG: CPBP family intramembrane glutamic endopeptidase [Phycisphaerae bacterium]
MTELPDSSPADELPAPPLARPAAPVMSYAPLARSALPGRTPSRALVQAVVALATFLAADAFIFAMLALGGAGGQQPSTGELALDLGGKCALVCVVIFLMLRRSGEGLASLGLGRPSARQLVLLAPAAMGVCYASNILIFFAYSAARGSTLEQTASEKMAGLDALSGVSFGAILPLAIAVGFYEEVLFRGLILSRLTTALSRGRPGRGSAAAAVVLTAVVFGGLHAYQGPIGVLQVTVLGLVFGALAAASGNIWACIVAHVGIDTMGLLATKLIAPHLPELLNAASRPAGG